MKVLITGIAGFIGFHTALAFHKEGHEVVGFDNFSDYYDPALKAARADLLALKNIRVHTADLKNISSFSHLFETNKPDFVIHLGAIAGVRYSMEFPYEYIETNILGTMNLISVCEKYDVQNVIYSSTSCVMHGNELPWKEINSFHLQLNPYGYSKLVNESQFEISKIPNAVGLRFFTVYGPYGRPDMALFDFTKKILSNDIITVYNYGNMKRDFTYIDDIVQGILLVSKNMSNRDMYCLGYGKQVDLMNFIEQIEINLGLTANKVFAPKHPADALETWSDTTKLQKLGYTPTVSIEEGVKRFVNWYKEFYIL